MGEAGRRFRGRGEIVTSCDATTSPRSVTAFRQHFAVSSSRHPRLKKKTLCGPWITKKTDGLWWVGVCFLGWGSRSPLGTRSVTSNPSPAPLDLWGPAAGEMVTRVGVSKCESDAQFETPSRPSCGALLLGA